MFSLKCVRLLIGVAAAALLVGCAASPTVRVLADPQLDLSRYQTFGFFEHLGTDRAAYASLVSERLKAASRREMEARGFTYTEENPDLLINFSGKLEDKLRVTQTPTTTIGIGAGWGGGYYGYRTGIYSTFPLYETDVREYQLGTLNIDLVDAARKSLIWEGIGERSVTRKDLENVGPAIDNIVSAIFRKFPIPPI